MKLENIFTRVILTWEFYPGKKLSLEEEREFEGRINSKQRDTEMIQESKTICTAFAGDRIIARGELMAAAAAVKRAHDAEPGMTVLMFDDTTGRQVELNLHGTEEEFLARLREELGHGGREKSGPGRPKLGVECREVCLLPKQWEWLKTQPGGASAALRRLVLQASKENKEADELRNAQESLYRFMDALAGNQPGYEEALRAMFAGDAELFEKHVDQWPEDIRNHALKMSRPVFEGKSGQ